MENPSEPKHPVVNLEDAQRTEKALKESEERYKALFSGSLHCVFTHDLEGRFLDVNNATLELLGYSREELDSLTLYSLLDQDQVSQARARIEEIAKTGSVREPFTSRMRMRNGQYLWVEIEASLIHKNGVSAIQAVARDSTEQQRMKESLRESEERFRQFFENQPDYCYMISPEGIILDVNSSALDILGYKKEEILGKPVISTIYAPSSARKAEKLFDRWKKTGKIENEEMNIISKTGEERTVLLSVEAIQHPGGLLLYSVSVQRDITDRKRAEEALRRSEEKYRTILQEIEDGYFEVDIAGNFTFLNDSLSRMLGYTKNELIGMNNREYMDSETAETVYETFNRVYRTGTPTRAFDWEIIRKDGTRRAVEASVSLMRTPTGEPSGFRGVVRDITERKEAEKKLRESEANYRFLVDHSLQGIIVTQGYRFVFVNPAFAEILGYQPEELLSLTPERVKATVHPDDQDLVWTRYQKRLEGKDAPPRYEFRVIRKDGTVRWMEQFAARIEFDGRPAVQTSVVDITERKTAEEQTRKFNLELEKRIAERSQRIEIFLHARERLQREKSWETGLEKIVESINQLGFEKVGVFLVDPSRKRLVFHSGRGPGLPEIGTSIPLQEKEYYGVRCVLEKTSIHFTDARLAEGKRFESGTSSFAWVPIVIQDEAFAALAVGILKEKDAIGEEDLKDLEILASMCAAFIDRTRMLVEPVAEKILTTERKHVLDPSEGYIVREKKPDRSLEIFYDLVTHGIPGFVISREYPEKIRTKYNLLKTPMLWLSRSEMEKTVSPDDLPKLSYIIQDFTRKCEESVVLLDGLEYLFTQVGFKTVVKLLHNLKDTVVINRSRLILPLHVGALSDQEYRILEKEFVVLTDV
ncbi:MAG: PAS domain S-box protein [Theionarchaea archaeon]|nr:PAS domain S-box protein [Theionarchaea archaeon]